MNKKLIVGLLIIAPVFATFLGNGLSTFLYELSDNLITRIFAALVTMVASLVLPYIVYKYLIKLRYIKQAMQFMILEIILVTIFAIIITLDQEYGFLIIGGQVYQILNYGRIGTLFIVELTMFTFIFLAIMSVENRKSKIVLLVVIVLTILDLLFRPMWRLVDEYDLPAYLYSFSTILRTIMLRPIFLYVGFKEARKVGMFSENFELIE